MIKIIIVVLIIILILFVYSTLIVSGRISKVEDEYIQEWGIYLYKLNDIYNGHYQNDNAFFYV